ncbi:trans-aconitate 2-methyltransferase-like [Haemaphysalis longicornis]
MDQTKGAMGQDKMYIGDWAETSDGAQAYARMTEDMCASRGAFLKFFSAAFPSSCPSPTDLEGNQRVPGRCLDIGCGPGGFTVDHLVPCLPAWCEKLLAVDNSEAMLQLAREKHPHPKVEYKRLDIANDKDVARFSAEEGRFEMVYSFAALHWIPDQHQAIRNIEKLMVPGGECFVSFGGTASVFDLFAALVASPRWTKYAQHLQNLVPVTNGMNKMELRSYTATLLDGLDLTPLAFEVFSVNHVLGIAAEELADFYTTSNPIYRLLSDMEKEDLRNFTQVFFQELEKKHSGKLIIETNRILIHAYKKSPQNGM